MNGLKYSLKYFEEIVCGGLLIVMISLVIVNVFLRYLFDFSISWAEEVATICFVWCVFIGARATYKHKMDMGIDLLINKAPLNIRNYLKLLMRCLLLAINAYIFYMAIIFTYIAWTKPTAVLGISSGIFNVALVLSFGLITAYTLKFLYSDVKMIHHKLAVNPS